MVLLDSRPARGRAESIFPLRVSETRCYFVTQQGKPFLYHADTGWQIFSRLTTEEAIEYLSFRKEQGFNTIRVQIAMAPEQTNRYGQLPFRDDVDFARPNETYHDHVAKVTPTARTSGISPRTGDCIKTETMADKKVRRIPSPPAEDLVLMVQTSEPANQG